MTVLTCPVCGYATEDVEVVGATALMNADSRISNNQHNSSATESPSSTNYEARVEDGKLFYEKRWYGVALAVLGSWNKLDRIGKKLEVTSS